jgi:hypothetical protein
LFEHCAPAAHCALVVQLAVQALLPQMKGAQGFVAGFTQLPLPLQVGAGCCAPAVQLAAPQLVPARLMRQAPAPLQVPSLPHGGTGLQRLSVCPLRMGAHVPLA